MADSAKPPRSRRRKTAASHDTIRFRVDHSLLHEASGDDDQVVGGRYRIVESIASGGMGRIYRVKHVSLQKHFALKIIHPRMQSDDDVVLFFHREANALSKLSHPNIVQVTDFGHDSRRGAYLVMEHLTGETLHDQLEREPIPALGVTLIVMLQVAQALWHMHEQDLIHCDIKPENIFLCRPVGPSEAPAVKLIDFGFSRASADGAELAHTEVAATPAYASPEQLEGKAPQASMDIYAVGCLLFELVTGSLPFPGESEEITRAKLSQPAPDPESLAGRPLDPGLIQTIDRALARDPSDRHPDMEALVFELHELRDRLAGFRPPRYSDPAAITAPRLPRMPTALPGFTLNPSGTIKSTGAAFRDMVAWGSENLLGRTLAQTRLGQVYPRIESDVAQAVQTGRRVHRTIGYPTDEGDTAWLLLWLAPSFDAHDEITSVSGVLLPLNSEP